jgi:hypothetical protein
VRPSRFICCSAGMVTLASAAEFALMASLSGVGTARV